VDRLYDWKANLNAPIQQSLSEQKKHVQDEFEQRCQAAVLNLNEQGLNVQLYWKNPDPRKFINIVPTSAITGVCMHSPFEGKEHGVQGLNPKPKP
jgi:translation initiation factor 5B